MQNKYNSFLYFLKSRCTIACVTHKSSKNVAAALLLPDDKAINSIIFLFSNHLKILFYLLIYCLVQQCVYQSWVYDVEELLGIWHGLLSTDNMLIEWAVIETVSTAMLQIRRMYFSNQLTVDKDIIKFGTQLCHRELVEQLQHF